MDAAQVGHAADSDDSCEIRVSARSAYQSSAVIALGKGEVESSILSCSTTNSSELSTVFSLKSLRAAPRWAKRSPRAFPQTAVEEAESNRLIAPKETRLMSVENAACTSKTFGPSKARPVSPPDQAKFSAPITFARDDPPHVGRSGNARG
jgi:hypothetical protein